MRTLYIAVLFGLCLLILVEGQQAEKPAVVQSGDGEASALWKQVDLEERQLETDDDALATANVGGDPREEHQQLLPSDTDSLPQQQPQGGETYIGGPMDGESGGGMPILEDSGSDKETQAAEDPNLNLPRPEEPLPKEKEAAEEVEAALAADELLPGEDRDKEDKDKDEGAAAAAHEVRVVEDAETAARDSASAGDGTIDGDEADELDADTSYEAERRDADLFDKDEGDHHHRDDDDDDDDDDDGRGHGDERSFEETDDDDDDNDDGGHRRSHHRHHKKHHGHRSDEEDFDFAFARFCNSVYIGLALAVAAVAFAVVVRRRRAFAEAALAASSDVEKPPMPQKATQQKQVDVLLV